ncbi:hypothetical protein KC337_g106 [Hortaea werneckii]|nr:hypothetical protein KC337_g106 [Hortaea werneckii]
MLAKQLRLKLVADDDSGIPSHFRNIMVSIHAIATFKALDDYLRPRIDLHERPRLMSRQCLGALRGHRARLNQASPAMAPRCPPEIRPSQLQSLRALGQRAKAIRTSLSKTRLVFVGLHGGVRRNSLPPLHHQPLQVSPAKWRRQKAVTAERA